MGCSPWGREESYTTERLHSHFSLSCIGDGNGNPLQCSCLENPRDWGTWWAAVYGVTQSQTRLKRLSSSSSGKETEAPGGEGTCQVLTVRGRVQFPSHLLQAALSETASLKEQHAASQLLDLISQPCL